MSESLLVLRGCKPQVLHPFTNVLLCDEEPQVAQRKDKKEKSDKKDKPAVASNLAREYIFRLGAQYPCSTTESAKRVGKRY